MLVTWIIVALIALCFVALGYLAVLMRRNHEVHRYRTELIDKIGVANFKDIAAAVRLNQEDAARFLRRCEERWEWFEAVSYEAMANRPWRSLDSFYPDRSIVLSTIEADMALEDKEVAP